MDKYWRAGVFDPKKTKLHEALHAAVAQLLGGEVVEIQINKDGSGWANTANKYYWQDLAVWLAPALIGDMSGGDEAYVNRQKPRRRGYAWGWLKKNRTIIMRRAKSIESKMKRPPGKLKWNPETTQWKWNPRRRAK